MQCIVGKNLTPAQGTAEQHITFSHIMAFFGLFGKSKPHNGHTQQPATAVEPTAVATPAAGPAHLPQDNIHALFALLSKDYQEQGYNDALVNPDASYMQQNMDAIQGDLKLMVRRVTLYYQDAVQEINFLIETRRRMGMADVVDELTMKLERARNHQAQVAALERELAEGLGDVQRVMISYKRGFTNGLAAIAYKQMKDIQF